MLTAFLDYYRGVMIRKIEGLDHDGLRFSLVPSGTCLGGLLKHLGYVERWWFQAVYARRRIEFPGSEDDPDADFRLDESDDAASLVAFYRGEVEASRAIVAEHPDLERTVKMPGRDVQVSLRWILVHMIEEVARHAGHADLLRERVDGATGD